MLKKREKNIVLAHLKEYKTFSAIGKEYNITGGRVGQIYKRAIRRIKNPARSRFLSDLTGQLEHDSAIEKAAKEARLQAVAINKAALEAITLEDLNLTVRNHNCLSRAGVKTLADIAVLTLKELGNIRNLGRKGYLEVLDACKKHGVVLDYQADA